LVPELMEIYPDAKVICTTREFEKWAESMEFVAKLVRPRLQTFLFFWVPHCCYLPRLWSLLPGIFDERYGAQCNTKADAMLVWKRHTAWLEEIVPKEKLFFVDMKDGWEPLCKALDVPVPKDVPFPRLNDSKSFERMFKEWAMQGLLRWALVFGAVIALCGVAWAVWTR
ncbi:hypothetical protein LTR37_020658, partial [Vermiconidia calcicola]